jgi:hypothetical protein
VISGTQLIDALPLLVEQIRDKGGIMTQRELEMAAMQVARTIEFLTELGMVIVEELEGRKYQ